MEASPEFKTGAFSVDLNSYGHVVRHIKSSDSGAQIGAFFDFDGTIIDGFSAFIFLREQLRQGYLKPPQIAKVVMALANYKMGLIDFPGVIDVGAEILAGIDEREYGKFSEKVYDAFIKPMIYPEARALIQAHRDKGHTIAIISSASNYQVESAARELGIEHVHFTRFNAENGVLNGEVEHPACWGEGKVAAVDAVVKQCGLDLSRSYFYSDSEDDLLALQHVGLPRVVNPSERLQTIASESGWPVQIFARMGKPTLIENVKSLGVYGSLIGSYLGGLGVWKANGSKDEGRRFMLSLFTDVVFPLTNIQVHVRNPENFWKKQPVVVIFNHQSQADGLIIMKLLKDNFAAIGKKEIGKFRLFAKAYEFAGVIPIDRENTASAIEAMQPLVDALVIERRNVAIAPEGTRSSTKKPGAFKKGAFHVAMQAGVPVLPVVIHNGMDIQPKGQFAYRPGCVEVEILEPVDTSRWTKKNLNKHVNEVRNSFLTALGFEAEPLDAVV